MPIASKLAELRRLVPLYSKLLSRQAPPSLEMGPGSRCAYNLSDHSITIGIDVLEHASSATCEAILAHELGHSVEPGFRLWRWLCKVLPQVCLAVSLFLLFTSQGPLVVGGCVALVLAAWGFVWRYPALIMGSSKYTLKLECSADAYAATIVGHAASHRAIVEYTTLFRDGKLSSMGEIRCRVLKDAYANEVGYVGM